MIDRPRPRLSLRLNGLSARQLAVETWRRMERHDAMVWAAAIAFYALFATVPLLALFLVVTNSAPRIGEVIPRPLEAGDLLPGGIGIGDFTSVAGGVPEGSVGR